MTNDSESESEKKNDGKNDAGKSGNDGDGTDKHAGNALSQSDYEKRIAELDKREKAIETKLQRLEAVSEDLQSQGVSMGGGQKKETPEETQKKTLLKNFGGCIDGLDEMI